MQIDPQLLQQTGLEGVRAVVQALLRDAEAALSRIEGGTDEESLHDFRVALRRLRSVLRSFRPQVSEWLHRRTERRLARLAQATTAARDAEVQLAWLARERLRLLPRAVPAVDWLAERLRVQRRTGYERISGRGAARFRRLANRLVRRLDAGRRAERGVEPGIRFGALLADLIRENASALDLALNAVTGPLEVRAGHQARIAAKRLRYLLEPLRGLIQADSTQAVKVLKDLQEILGELHDAHVACDLLGEALAEVSADRARRAHAAILADAPGGPALRAALKDDLTRGLLVLDRRSVERAGDAYRRFAGEWLPQAGTALTQAVAGVVEGLEASARPVDLERRRFLLMRIPGEVRPVPGSEIETGWLPGPGPRAWVCRVREGDRVRHFQGESSALGSAPIETEISQETFDHLWPSTEGCRLRKYRRRVVDGGRVWFLDVLIDQQPVLAEVPAAPGKDLRAPRWLEPVIVREVTAEKAYQEVRLASRRRRPVQTAPEPAPVAIAAASHASGAAPEPVQPPGVEPPSDTPG